MKRSDFSNVGIAELKDELSGVKKELFDIRLNSSNMHLKDYSQFRKLRVKIARILTELNSRKKSQKSES